MYALPATPEALPAPPVPTMPVTAVLRQPDGTVLWNHLPGDTYSVEGIDLEGRRRQPFHTHSWHHARLIELSHGQRFLHRNGRRYLLQEL